MPRAKKDTSTANAFAKRADELIATLEKEKVALQKQIEGVNRKIEEIDRRISDLNVMKRTLPLVATGAESARIAVQPKSTQPSVERAAFSGDSQIHEPAPVGDGAEMPSMAAVIRKLTLNQPGHFTPAMVDELMRAQYPEVHKKLPKNYISSNIWRLANGKSKLIRIVESGGPGGNNVYEVVRTSASSAP